MSTHGAVARTVTDAETDTWTIPGDLESAEAKLVYHSLDAAGPGDADDLSRRLDLGKLSLFGVLGTLQNRDLVEYDGSQYCCT